MLDEAAIHLYIAGRAQTAVDGVNVTLRQTTQYPWQGAIELAVDPERDVEFALRLRVPAWCRSAHLQINGAKVDVGPLMDRGYAHIRRRWRKGDVVLLTLDMPAERIYAHPEVAADAGRVALKRGPIVYCLEGADNDVPAHRIALPRSSSIEAHFESTLMSGVGMLTAEAVVGSNVGGRRAVSHRSAGHGADDDTRHTVQFWSNRGPEEMSVWIREV